MVYWREGIGSTKKFVAGSTSSHEAVEEELVTENMGCSLLRHGMATCSLISRMNEEAISVACPGS
jgi:hypothetical protein